MQTESIVIIIALLMVLGLLWWSIAVNRRRTLEHQRALLEHFPMGSVGLDPAERVLHWNARLSVITGIQPDAVNGQMLSQIPQPWGRMLDEYLKAPGEATQEFEMDGQHFSLHKTRLGNQAPMPTVILLEDRTDAFQLTRKLAHQDRLASLGQLAAGVAHEIGNPLTGIDSLAQLLPSSEAESRDLIREQVGRINQIIRNLLKFSREGEAQAPTQSIETQNLIDDALRLFKLDPQFSDTQVVIRRNTERVIQGDPVALSQVLINLFRNAVQAVEAGPATLWIDSFENGDGHWQFDLEDNGSGIPQELLPRIFEPFVSGHLDDGGTGLGLSICYGIVQQHDGQIHAISPSESGGAKITITLPIQKEDRG